MITNEVSDGLAGILRTAIVELVRRDGPDLSARQLGGNPKGRSGIAQDRPHLPQESHAGRGALHQHAAAIQRIDLAASKLQFAQPVERARDGRLRDVEVGGQTADGVSTLIQIAGQEYPKLASGQVSPIPANQ